MTSGGTHPNLFEDTDKKTRRRAFLGALLRVTLAWIALLAIYFGVPFDRPSEIWPVVMLVVLLALFFYVAAIQIRRTSHSYTPVLQAVVALGTLTPLLIVMFAGVYFGLSASWPDTFNEQLTKVDSIYFTITTLSTVGFGDIVAVSTPARLIVCLQILVDLILVGVIVRTLGQAVQVGRAQEPPRENPANG